MRPYCTAVIMAAGKGKRMGTDISKQFLPVCGKEILAWTVEKFEASPSVDEIILMAGKEGREEVQELCDRYGWKKIRQVALGGKERQDSVANGLELLSAQTEVVLIHDGVRPFVTEEMIRESIEGALSYGGCVIGVPAKDTIKVCDKNQMAVETPERSTLWQIQTPQTFQRELICRAYEKAKADGFLGTDDASVAEHMGRQVYVAKGDYRNIKITTKEDLVIAEAFIREEKA
ncbi:2-C-methyl-D-erythritol 4-phosphate cytidylyltransferase [Anaerotignum lactatifermentans]|uniref:2-C-methyl-D-erythritol 4-phosphate cytidylyltransferase n=1 Tax=Anaerotignum lactatifermentans TaxID=160404 RepID=A0ABS2G9T2_9FIRM|nr:2-C-methyl-D-erythritol 4-phosphate cytidylyltransferase [Anaerotignum lactatifermentans]MBM6828357.1 2-C-methyl-D-erythritol 4-phosphate cytidylyltransferase [Anaerotignum lactatifermentans]MBM6877637.1 2-C-methyl-D-erythritol 4-phosphate cytidylyltransferase [Anaerotignum lactatifermentans]MBM6949940.1 2-C-methyl-D-erythritol 4-phosphate cytidylyltransferase [Anaerotignum lactatifermentans]